MGAATLSGRIQDLMTDIWRKLRKAVELHALRGTQVLFAGLAARLGRVTLRITVRIRADILGNSALASRCARGGCRHRQIRDAVGGLGAVVVD